MFKQSRNDWIQFIRNLANNEYVEYIKRKYSDGNAHEEFFIPQLICHNLLFSNKELYTNYLGIAYTSTKDYKSKCLAIPAIYKSKEIKWSGYCDEILSLFEISQPSELK